MDNSTAWEGGDTREHYPVSSPTDANLGTGVNSAVKLGATVVSNSYGGGEDSSVTSSDAYYHHPGVGIFARWGLAPIINASGSVTRLGGAPNSSGQFTALNHNGPYVPPNSGGTESTDISQYWDVGRGQTMTFHEYLSNAVQDDAQLAGERDRLALVARQARTARRKQERACRSRETAGRLLLRRAPA